MTKKEMIQAYVAANPEPNEEFCPNICVRWKGNNSKLGGQYEKFYVLNTGRITVNKNPFAAQLSTPWPERQYVKEQVWVVKKYPMPFFYIRFVPEYEMLEIATVYINMGRPAKDVNMDIRKFSYGKYSRDRIFLFRKDTTPYNIHGENAAPDDDGKYYNKMFASWFTNMISNNIYSNFLVNQFRLFVNGNTEEAKDWSDRVDYPYSFLNNYYKKINRAKTPEGKSVIDALTKLPIKESKEIQALYHVTGTKSSETTRYGSGSYDTTALKATPIYFQDFGKDGFTLSVYRREPYSVKRAIPDYDKLPDGSKIDADIEMKDKPVIYYFNKRKLALYRPCGGTYIKESKVTNYAINWDDQSSAYFANIEDAEKNKLMKSVLDNFKVDWHCSMDNPDKLACRVIGYIVDHLKDRSYVSANIK